MNDKIGMRSDFERLKADPAGARNRKFRVTNEWRYYNCDSVAAGFSLR